MATLNPIRIGDTLQRTYRFYEPVTPVTDPPVADTDSPIDLSDIEITFKVQNDLTLRSYDDTTGLTITPLLGTVELNIDTSEWDVDDDAESYLVFVYENGSEISKCHLRENIVEREFVS